jgi:hypothetical protein
MPFTPLKKRFTKGKRKGQKMYRGPSGRTFNMAQVRLAYATNNFGKGGLSNEHKKRAKRYRRKK